MVAIGCAASGSCNSVACQTDGDCAAGKTCYAVLVRSGPNGATRTIGVCR